MSQTHVIVYTKYVDFKDIHIEIIINAKQTNKEDFILIGYKNDFEVDAYIIVSFQISCTCKTYV